MLARQDVSYKALAERFNTIYFLATPHRGSDSAQVLHNILHAAYNSSAYVAELKRNSGAIQVINDEFRQYSGDVNLWSFYETQKLSLKLFSKLIVDKDSATLGYREEKQIPVNADHRSICKFDTPADPNYRTLRNSLASTVHNITRLGIRITRPIIDVTDKSSEFQSKDELRRSQMKSLEKYLGVCGKPEDDLMVAQDSRLPGTCEWFASKKSYLEWKAFSSGTPRILWLNGHPAAGKSVLAGYVIGDLQTTNFDYSYFFFKYGDKSKSQLSSCLRSIAFQMALVYPQVLDKFLEMQNDGIKLDEDNERVIWRKLFVSGVFELDIPRHYWVIDGLDECFNFASFFAPMLGKLHDSILLQVFITGRQSVGLEKQFSSLGPHHFHADYISSADTLPDIKLLVEDKVRFSVVNDDQYRAALVDKVLEKSKGSFLWTSLVLSELANAHGEEEIDQILDDMPRDMEPLYSRILLLMSQATWGKKLAKAVLAWSSCAVRPLTTHELEVALQLDVNDKFLNLTDSISALCGQLVHVDRFNKVQMVHETAREFLRKDGLQSEFAVKPSIEHTRLSKACLAYLTGEEMRPPRTRRRSSTRYGKKSPFESYAREAFSDHLFQSDPCANDVFILVITFLRSNILSWIEAIAQTQNLSLLIHTAENLGIYLNACVKERSPIGQDMQTLRGWTTDLVRITARFGNALLASPSAIYWLILPFCPPESAAYKAGSSSRRLSVVGLSNTQWDDRLSCVDFHDGQPTAVCHGDEFFAIGLNTGSVALYNGTSCQEYKVFDHGETVTHLQFQDKTNLLASCGQKTIRLWDIYSGDSLHTFQAPPRSMCLAFDEKLLLAVSYGNYIASWDLITGTQLSKRTWHDSDTSLTVPPRPTRQPPCGVSISLAHKMLAVAYRGRPITLWDLEEGMYYGSCGKKLPNGLTGPYLINALVFNPNPNIPLLAATYQDGDLVLLDPFNDITIERFRANSHVLAASPDGRTLVGADGFGTIQVYEFETLRLLYRITSTTANIRQLAFSKDNLHFLDIRGSQCNVWEPPVLTRNYAGDIGSESEGTSESTTSMESSSSDRPVNITALASHPKASFLFCGKDDGSVAIYDLQTGRNVRTLYRHKSQCLIRVITFVTFGFRNEIVMSVDSSNTIVAWKVANSQSEGFMAETLLFQSRLDCGHSINQVLASQEYEKFILSTRESDHLWKMTGHEEAARQSRSEIRKWLQHPQSTSHLICIEGTVAHIYSWIDWTEMATFSIAFEPTELKVKNAIASKSAPRIVIELSEKDSSRNTRAIHVFDFPTISPELEPATAVSNPLSQFSGLTSRVSHVIDICDNQLVFVDNHSWVCSADLGSLVKSYMRHFFLPHDWFSSSRDIICAVVATGIQKDFVFARNDDVAVVKGGLEHVERIDFD